MRHSRVTFVSCKQMMSAFSAFSLSFKSPLRDRRPLIFHERILIMNHFKEFCRELFLFAAFVFVFFAYRVLLHFLSELDWE